MASIRQRKALDSTMIAEKRSAIPNSGLPHLLLRMRRHWQLYLLLILPLAYIIIFSYVPILGAQIAFRDYKVAGGIWNSEWVGLANFQRFFNSYQFSRLIVNTIELGIYLLVVGFPIPIIVAL